MDLTKPDRQGLTERGARKILELRNDGMSFRAIAFYVGCSPGTVWNVCKGPSWAYLRNEGFNA